MDLGAAETDEEREATYRFLNDEIGAQHAHLMDLARETDTKATVVAGFAAAAISFLLDARRGPLWWAALVCYASAFASSLATMWPRNWAGLPPADVHRKLSRALPLDAVGRIAGSKVAVFERNRVGVRRKAVLWMASVLLLSAGVPALGSEHRQRGRAMKLNWKRKKKESDVPKPPVETETADGKPVSGMVTDEELIGTSILPI